MEMLAHPCSSATLKQGTSRPASADFCRLAHGCGQRLPQTSARLRKLPAQTSADFRGHACLLACLRGQRAEGWGAKKHKHKSAQNSLKIHPKPDKTTHPNAIQFR